MNKTFKNIFYVFLQQFVNTILPFLTIPYIARVLGVEQNGVYSYSLTIVNLFAVFFALGFAVYGTNEIAQSTGEKRNIKYIEIQVLRMSCLIVGLVLFLCFLNMYKIPYDITVFSLQSLVILSSIFDNSWYYQGTGNFKKIVTRNIVVKIVGTLSIFLFVKHPEDLDIYIILISGSQLLGNVILFVETIHLFKYLKLIKFKNLWRHLKVSLVLFLPNISVFIYSSFDKLLLGHIGDIEGLSNYQQVQRIITFAYAFLIIPSPVLIQKVAFLRSKIKHKEADSIISKGLNFYSIVGLLVIFLILLSSKEFITLFLGDEYNQAVKLFILVSPVLLFKCIGTVIGLWYLVPLGKNKLHSFPLVIGTVFSVMINSLITPYFGVVSAAVIFTLTELIVIFIQLIYSRNLFIFIELKTLLLFFTIFLISFMIVKIIFLRGYGIDGILLIGFLKVSLFLIFSITTSLCIQTTRCFIKDINGLLKKVPHRP
ncbi:oligosaccharide flippase family protein [Priestia flexa]|uniref:oligosaccharide flippase family protein n=1 Tax=Priestia flexa TaxID=86664 RepID=UPI000C23DAC9|nr:oligosaccharide flippase family protein [Priestia flexa]MEC0666414.1 oligosaccharide flippase family protein [Priestia flexa]